ncbi:HNH endonuclease [Comamonas testosteroni]|uniref:HNH endonuclease n=1 Tax=Comamonas testosteroni TaxID=285 RepID=UPI0026602BD3|nr:HNH endonuclease [Comamonas testosteroni]WKL15086.1 HNH endonuclease [Comamonas testosteroni]
MNREQQSAAYQIARSVRDGGVSQKAGAAQMHRDIGLKLSTASFLIYVYLHMSSGSQYKRALSAPDSDYLLEKIRKDDGLDRLHLALQAFRLHIEYREGMGVTQKASRKILRRHEHWLEQLGAFQNGEPVDIYELNLQFEHQIQRSQSDSVAARQKRLSTASTQPQRITKLVRLFQRNPDVVAEALYRANGTCGNCGSEAPFKRRSDKSPYLEVHHKIPLADGGDDTVENAIALCPNCHRGKHFGPIDAESSHAKC